MIEEIEIKLAPFLAKDPESIKKGSAKKSPAYRAL